MGEQSILKYKLDNELGYFLYRGLLFAGAILLILVGYPLLSYELTLHLDRLLFLAPLVLLWSSGFFSVRQHFEFDLTDNKVRYVLSVVGFPLIRHRLFDFSEVAGVTIGGSVEDMGNTLREGEEREEVSEWCYALFLVLHHRKVLRITGFNGRYREEKQQAEELSRALGVHYLPAEPETLPHIEPHDSPSEEPSPSLTNVGRRSWFQMLWFRYMLEVLIFGIPFFAMLKFVGVL